METECAMLWLCAVSQTHTTMGNSGLLIPPEAPVIGFLELGFAASLSVLVPIKRTQICKSSFPSISLVAAHPTTFQHPLFL